MSSLFQPGAPNYSVLAIPATWVLNMIPHWYAIVLAETSRVQGGWDNSNPRAYVAALQAKRARGDRMTSTENRILRAEAAQMNGHENLALFGVAVLAGNMARLPTATLNKLSAAYMLSRIIYNTLYIRISGREASFARTGAFLAGLSAIFSLIIKAGRELA